MVQIKIYGLREHLDPIKPQLSETIHACVMEVFHYPADKRFHRFFPLDQADFFYPAGRSDRYTILELSLIEGRTIAAKKALMRLLFDRLQQAFRISPQDLEITFFENPKHNWGFRGLPGDEHRLDYSIDI